MRIKRNILFWGSAAEKMVGMLIVLNIVYTAFFTTMAGGSAAEGVVGTNYLLMCVGIFSLIMPITSVQSNVPFVISFGSGRREAIWGLQFMNIITMIQYMILFKISLLFYPLDAADILLAAMPVAILAIYAVAQFIGALILKIGMKGLWAMIILIPGYAAIMVWLLSAGEGGRTLAITDLQSVLPYFAIGAVLLYALSVLTLMVCVRRFEVHR